MTLTNRTTIAVIWNFAEQLSRRGINVAVTLLLAYFLSPEDFGFLAMIAIFLAVATSLMESGFREALIRLKKVSTVDLNTVFYSNLLLSVVAYVLLFLSAPAIANFYNEPILVELVQITGVVVVFNAFHTVQVVILSRDLDFKSQLKATLPASLISGIIAILMAYLGYGVFSLAAQVLVSSFVSAVLLWKQSHWKPELSFSYDSVKLLFGFGSKLFLSGLLAIFAKNMFSVVIAKFYTATVAGFYYLVEKMLDILMSQLVYSIQNVTYPALSSIQDETLRLKDAYRKVIKLTTFIVFPILFFMAALAEPLFKTIFPEKWWPANHYFQIMCLVFLLYPLHAINLNILKVKGRSDIFLKLEVVKVTIAMIMLSLTISHGVEVVLYGQVITSIIAYFFNSYYSVKLINYSIREQVLDFLPGFIISFSIAIIVFSIHLYVEWIDVLEFLVLGSLASIMYLFISYALQIKAYLMLTSMVKEKLIKS